jgi:hypothetical protein
MTGRITGNHCKCSDKARKTKKPAEAGFFQVANPKGIIGSGGRDRTYDQLINSQLLYR